MSNTKTRINIHHKETTQNSLSKFFTSLLNYSLLFKTSFFSNFEYPAQNVSRLFHSININEMNSKPSSCYILDYLKDLHKRSHLLTRTNYLYTLENERITEADREATIKWLFEIAEYFKPQSKTVELAICYIDEFLRKKTFMQQKELELLAFVSFSLALKYEEGQELGLDSIVEVFEEKYSLDEVACIETVMLNILEWDLDRPTASEIIALLLEYTCDPNNLELFIENVDSFADVCYVDYELSEENPFVLAVSSTLCMLDWFKIHDFREAWLKEVEATFELEMDSVEYCCKKVNSKLDKAILHNN